MSVSLLDLLTCGLAAVIILLVISLNSGAAFEAETAPAVFVEVRIYGPAVIRDDRVRIRWNGTEHDLRLEDEDYSSSIKHIAFPEAVGELATKMATSVYHARALAPRVRDGIGFSWGTEILLAIPPMTSDRLELEIDFEPDVKGELYFFEVKLFDASSERERLRRGISPRLTTGPSCLSVVANRSVTVRGGRPTPSGCGSSGTVMPLIQLTGAEA